MKTSKRLLGIFASIVVVLMFFSVVGTVGALAVSQKHIVKVGNESVRFMGENATIGFGNQFYDTGWILGEYSSATLSDLSFTQHGYREIINGQQESYSLLENNSNFRVAEIYSFHEGSIDASIAIQNLQNVSVNFIATFYAVTSPHNHILVSGVVPKLFSTSTSGMELPGNSWGTTMGQVNINWQNEASIFSAGIIKSDSVSSKTLVAFGPVNISSNETYTIDPVVSPTTALSQIYHFNDSGGKTASPMSLPIPPGGGGGSGGGSGGSSGSGPSNVKISVTPKDTTPASKIWINVTSYDAGSGGVSFSLQAETFSNSWSPLGNPGKDIHWATMYGYKAVRIHASNSYGSANSNSVAVYIFDYPQTSLTEYLYSASTSQPIGVYSPAVSFHQPGTVTEEWAAGPTDVPIYVGTVANWNDSYAVGIWSFNQAITLYGTYGFTPGLGSGTNLVSFDTTNIQDSIQTGSSSTIMGILMTYLITVADSFVHGLIPSPLSFNPYGVQQGPEPIPIYFNDTGSEISVKGLPVWSPIYESGIGYTPVRDFGIKTWNDQISANSQTNFQMFLEYSCSIALLESDSAGSTYAGSTALVFQFNVAASS